jgi:predicted ATPase/DNA-binding SARP family transcriptional activator
MVTLRINLFGTPYLTVDDVPLSAKLARKEQWLLALLALRQGKPITRDYLTGLLWPDCLEEQALYNLRRSLNRLRDALGAHADRIEAVKPRSLCLSLNNIDVDVLEFDRLTDTTTEALEQKVALYRAPLLQDCFEEWALTERAPREFAYRQALEALAAQALQRGDWQATQRYANLSIAADPLQEQAYRTLMTALARMDSHAAATGVYRDLRLRLREEVNAEPAPETRALFESIRAEARQTTTTVVPESAPTPPPSIPPAADVGPIPTPPEPMRPFRVPIALNRIIGREEEIAAVDAHLRSARLVTLLGAGGVGKTRLALEVAARAAEAFEEGAIFVKLASVTHANLVAGAVAQTLDIPEQAGRSPIDTLCERLKASKILLVLDNCEHLVEAVAPLCRTLLSACPNLRMLATSRQPLGLTAEIVHSVSPLAMPPTRARTLLRRAKTDSSVALEYPAVKLFLERARQAQPQLRLGPTDIETIGLICTRLDGIPLAIELAASRVRALSLEQIAARLEDRFRLLRGGLRSENPHHETLQGLLDWSYQLLDEPERRLFERLSVFAGGFTLATAEALCANQGEAGVQRPAHASFPDPPAAFDFDVLDRLTSLVDKSLVVMEQRHGEARYRMLETIRQYAAGRLSLQPDEPTAMMRRMRDYWAAFGRDLWHQQNRSDGARWIAVTEMEWDNLRAVLSFCAQDPPSITAGLVLASHLCHFCELRGYISEGRGWLETLLTSDVERAPTRERFAALSGVSGLCGDQADYKAARRYSEEALETATAIGVPSFMSVALNSLGSLHLMLYENETARDYLERSLEIARQSGTPKDVASGLNNLALALTELARYDEARSHLERALAINRETGNRIWELYNLVTLGSTVMRSGDNSGALPYLTQAMVLAQELDDPHRLAKVLCNLGIVLIDEGDLVAAEARFVECLPIFEQFEDRAAYAKTLLSLADATLRRGQWDTAACMFAMAEATIEEIGGHSNSSLTQYRDGLRVQLYEHVTETAFAREMNRAKALDLGQRTALSLDRYQR